MMSVRKREWAGPAGIKKVAWQVDYRDNQGKRRSKQFARKKEADDFASKAGHEVRQGTHTADSQSITVAKAAELWLAKAERDDLEGSTIDAYDQHVRLHIVPFIGAKRLNQLTKPMIEAFRDDLVDGGRSKAMVPRVLRSLSSIVKEAERLGYVARNVAAGVTVRRGSREKPKVVPPSKADIRALIEQARKSANSQPMWAPMLLTLVFAGLRASELRGLAWRNIDLERKTITIDRRADRENVIGPPKSAAGWRTIPVPDVLVTELRAWKLRCAASAFDLVFPSAAGTPIFHANIVLRFQDPLQIAAGITRPKVSRAKPVLDIDGTQAVEGRYTLHCFRHAAASLWIERKVAPKRVQTWMGHSSIQVTFDTYGHLFAALEDDSATMAAIEAELLGQAVESSRAAA
jgi:integrase